MTNLTLILENPSFKLQRHVYDSTHVSGSRQLVVKDGIISYMVL